MTDRMDVDQDKINVIVGSLLCVNKMLVQEEVIFAICVSHHFMSLGP